MDINYYLKPPKNIDRIRKKFEEKYEQKPFSLDKKQDGVVLNLNYVFFLEEITSKLYAMAFEEEDKKI